MICECCRDDGATYERGPGRDPRALCPDCRLEIERGVVRMPNATRYVRATARILRTPRT